MSRIVTFYSYKGGVGRTFALANIAALLAKKGKRVLLMDWDLEAPGLHRYFKPLMESKPFLQEGLIHLLSNAAKNPSTAWQPFVTEVKVQDSPPIHIIASGDQARDYVERVRLFSWTNFFENQHGGDVLDRWRKEWKGTYDFVLVDSRTGITDTGGVCTVFLPDILVFVFSANEQSFECGMRIVNGVQDARLKLAVPRAPLTILPLPGRFDGRDEVDEANRWLDRFAKGLKPFYDDWLPKHFHPRQILELTKIPYITRFSFGEPLVVITHSVSDPELPGFYLENVARLLSSDFADAQQILSGGTDGRDGLIAEFRTQLARVPIEETAIDQVLKLIESDIGSDFGMSDLLREAGVALLRQSRFTSAETYLRRSISLSEEQLGSEHPNTATTLFHLAELLQATNRLSEAESLYLKALEVNERILGPSHPSVISTYANLASLYKVTERFAEAEMMYQQVLHMLEMTEGRSGNIANVYNNLASLYKQTQRFKEAEVMYQQALRMLEMTGQSGDLANAYNNLASLYKETRSFNEAETMYQQALLMLEMTGRSGDLANAYNNLASLYKETQRFNEAETMYQQALHMLEMTGRSGDLANAYNNLASLYKETQRFNEAETMYQQALHMLEMTGRSSGDLAKAYNNLASLYKDTQRFNEAETMYQQALHMLEMSGRSSDLANAYNNLASLYKETQRFNEAEAMYEKALYILKKTASGRPAQARSLNGLGEVLIAKGKIQEAESALRRALTIFESTYNRNHPEAVKAKENLARILESKGENDEARSLRDQVEFDTFISYNSTDRRIVHQLARELEARRVRVWLDDNELLPGMSLVDAMSQVLYISRSAVVCIGSSEQNPWQSEELKALLLQSIDEGRPVIPVLLPGAKPHPQLPRFLMSVACLDLRDGMSKEGLDKLTEAITGRKPRLL